MLCIYSLWQHNSGFALGINLGELSYQERCRDWTARSMKATSLNITDAKSIAAIKLEAADKADTKMSDLTLIVQLFLVMHIIDFIFAIFAGQLNFDEIVNEKIFGDEEKLKDIENEEERQEKKAQRQKRTIIAAMIVMAVRVAIVSGMMLYDFTGALCQPALAVCVYQDLLTTLGIFLLAVLRSQIYSGNAKTLAYDIL